MLREAHASSESKLKLLEKVVQGIESGGGTSADLSRTGSVGSVGELLGSAQSRVEQLMLELTSQTAHSEKEI